MKKISALTLRKKLGAILDEVAGGEEPIAITRANQPLVVMESYATYEARTNREERRRRLLEASRRIDEWAKRNAKFMKKGSDVVTLIRKSRDNR